MTYRVLPTKEFAKDFEKVENLEDQRKKLKKVQHERWQLSNLSQNIRQVRNRLDRLKKWQEIPELNEELNGVKIKTSKDDNRIRLYFEKIPSEQTRNKLKQNGFRWSPYNRVWQRMINSWAIELARSIAQEVKND